jgi:plastocyanin domain-containing protein
MSEKNITAEQVREEHLKEVNQPLQWTYLFSILGGSLILMLILMVLLEG